MAQVTDLLREFVELARSLQTIRPDLALASAVPLGALPLTQEGLGFAAICEMRGGIDKDRWRYIQSRRNIAPFSESPSVQVPGLDEEYMVDGDRCLGLAVAACSGQLAVSFKTHIMWDSEFVEVTRTRLLEDDVSSDIVEDAAVVSVRHASRQGHAGVHGRFVADLALPDPFSGSDLWDDRVIRYPSMQFLPRVEHQVRMLGHGSAAVGQVHDRLCELDAAAADWDPAEAAFPDWRSNVTPEAGQRKQLCMFTDLDGETRCFDLHARFTPGHGRIHFRLVPETRTLRIAHVGVKLGA